MHSARIGHEGMHPNYFIMEVLNREVPPYVLLYFSVGFVTQI